MDFRKIDEAPQTFIIVFKTGDELAEGLLRFAKEQKLSDASFKAVGAALLCATGMVPLEQAV
ncbi:MAG: hypothetical protein WCA38_15000 [Candidatus Acidiferrales bacterium]